MPAGVSRRRSTSGSAMLEFGLLAPVFVTVFAGIVDIGKALYVQAMLESAVEAGVNYVLLPTSLGNVNSSAGSTLASNTARIVVGNNPNTFLGSPSATVVVNNGPSATSTTGGTPTTAGTASNADNYYCLTGTPGSWTWGSSVSGGSNCTGGGLGGRFVTITASYSYVAFLPIFSSMQDGTVSIAAAVQTQ
jgi:Flp pilus assembly protein TadG